MKIRAFYLGSILFGILSLGLAAREPLTFDERVKAQEAIERVYYSHRIWPKENSQPKPPFEKMVTKEQIEAKVTDYLKKCSALDQFWQRPIIASQLQAEMDRMTKGTKDPATLNELFAALNNDPYLIAECLARPILADRLIHNWYANDERFHGETKAKAVDELKTLTPENFCGFTDGQYSKMTYRLEVEGREEMEDLDPEDRSIKLEEKEFAKMFAEIPEEGKISGVIEKNDCFVITHTISRNEVEIEIETLIFEKQGVEEWLKDQELHAELPGDKNGAAGLFLPPMPEAGCVEEWDNGSLDDLPGARYRHTTIWTGSEMIIWGGYNVSNLNTGGRYNPAMDTWTTTSTGEFCPSARSTHTAVWTGTEMIVWGLGWVVKTGGCYNPLTDRWRPTSTGTGCPQGRGWPTAVWTGTEVIVWGGRGQEGTPVKTGGRYNPSTDTWVSTSTGTDCPAERYSHTAVWTGKKMIIWGGRRLSVCLETGGRYDPSTNSWLPTSLGPNLPYPREYHTAVWTGSVMIVWGGQCSGSYKTGGRYDPETDSWTPTSTGINCPSERYYHTAVWTATEMIIWGGSSNSGGRYNPSTDTWTATSTGVNCPSARQYHTAVWTGTDMIVWGGSDSVSYLDSGGRYDPAADTWVPTMTWPYCPTARTSHTALWTGTEMIVWGGYIGYDINLNDGGRYNPSIDSWTQTSITNAPSTRSGHTAVWTGTEMIVWGGYYYDGSSHYLNTGGRYNTSTDTWVSTSVGMNCPSGRLSTAVWTGTEMIVWGGRGGDYLYFNDGGRYNPSTNSWTATSTINAPTTRGGHTAVWTGTEMAVWGGYYYDVSGHYLNTGGIYDPTADEWTATSTGANCPSARSGQTSVWTGGEMIVWGGGDGSNNLNSGGHYSPSTDSWKATSTGTNCPSARSSHSAVWTGRTMIVWGGTDITYSFTGGCYEPLSDAWSSTLTGTYCPVGRSGHTAIWTGSEMIIWGGYSSGYTASGGIYYIPYAPFGWQDNFASDDEGCASDSGVLVEWSAPLSWGDGGSGTRTFDILRDGTPVVTGLSESTLSYTDTTGDNGVTYLYQVRANNGCGHSTTTTGMSAADNIGTSPEEVSNFDDVYSWDPVSGADGYRLYRGTLADLPNLLTLTADSCLRYEGTATSYDLSGDAPSEAMGNLYWYLVTAYTGVCEGTAGDGTGFTRVLSSSGVCP